MGLQSIETVSGPVNGDARSLVSVPNSSNLSCLCKVGSLKSMDF